MTINAQEMRWGHGLKGLLVALVLAGAGLAQNQPAEPAKAPAAPNPVVLEILKQAQTALDGGKYKDAITAYEDAIAIDFNNYSAHFGLGLAFYRLGDLKGAAFEFNQLTVLGPDRYEGWYNLAVVRDRQAQPGEAAQGFAKAIEVGTKAKLDNADIKPAYRGQVKALRDQNRFDEAASAARKALEVFPADAELTAALANSLYQGNKPLEALPVFYEVLGQDPSNIQAVSTIADIYVAQGLPERALREIDRALQVSADNKAKAQLLFKRGNLLTGKAQQDAFAEAAKLDPKLWPAQYNLGLNRLRAGDGKGAVEAFQNAYQQAPEEPKILLGLAAAYERLSSHAEVARYAALASRLTTGADKAEALILQGKAAYNLNRFAEAKTLLTEATGLKADRSTAWFYLGSAQYNTGDYNGAIASLEKARSLEAGVATLSNLGAAYLATSKFSEAEQVLTQAVSLDAKNAVAYYNLGWALKSLSRDQEARRAWQRALDLGYEPARQLLR
jgi:tetratricopeptide (TPR) repeat protein